VDLLMLKFSRNLLPSLPGFSHNSEIRTSRSRNDVVGKSSCLVAKCLPEIRQGKSAIVVG
jgi:hypothetical protein